MIKSKYMGSSYYREKRHREEWTKRIDIALLFQLQAICTGMKKRAALQQDRELADWANAIRLILATVNEEIANIELKKYQLPDDHREIEPEEATDAMPNLRILKLRSR